MSAALDCQEGWSVSRRREVSVFNSTKKTQLAARVRIADSLLGRLVGLLGKQSLDQDSGLLIFPSNSIHTLGMRFPIDVVFLDQDWRVEDLCESVPPFRLIWPRWKARSVLEVPIYSIRNSRTEVGDQLVLSKHSLHEGGCVWQTATSDS